MSETQLERSVLEAKEREELFAIADALGAKPAARAKKADLVSQILRATGIEPEEGAPAEKPRRTSARKAPAATVAQESLPVEGDPTSSPAPSGSTVADPPRTDLATPDLTGPDPTGPDLATPDLTDPDSTGPDPTGPDRSLFATTSAPSNGEAGAAGSQEPEAAAEEWSPEVPSEPAAVADGSVAAVESSDGLEDPVARHLEGPARPGRDGAGTGMNGSRGDRERPSRPAADSERNGSGRGGSRPDDSQQ